MSASIITGQPSIYFQEMLIAKQLEISNDIVLYKVLQALPATITHVTNKKRFKSDVAETIGG